MKHSPFNENSFLNFHNNRLAEKCVVSFIQHFIYDAETQRETFSSLKHTEQTAKTRKKRKMLFSINRDCCLEMAFPFRGEDDS
jgi:hypothetical protein